MRTVAGHAGGSFLFQNSAHVKAAGERVTVLRASTLPKQAWEATCREVWNSSEWSAFSKNNDETLMPYYIFDLIIDGKPHHQGGMIFPRRCIWRLK